MAKAKSTNNVKQPATVSASRKPPAAAAKKSASAASLPAISSEEIGRVSGEVWGLLIHNDGQSLAAIKKAVDAPADVVVAAIGWLAREDKLEFTTSGRMVKISLR